MSWLMIWHYQYTLYIWPMILSALAVAGLGGYCLRHRSMPGAVSLAIAMFVVIPLVSGDAMELMAMDAPAKVFWHRFQELWLLPAIVTALWFVLEYANLGHWLTRRNLVLFSIPILIHTLLVLTNDFHHLMWVDDIAGGMGQLARGPVLWIMVGYGYLLITLHVIVLIWLFVKSPRHRWPAVLLLISRILTALFFVFDLTGLNPFPSISLSVPTVVVAIVVYSIAFFGFGILDPVPLAHGMVIEQMQEGMLVLGIDRRIMDMNPSTEKIFHISLGRTRGRKVEKALPEFASLDENQGEIVVGEGSTARHYALNRSSLLDPRGFPLGMLILFHDVTEQKQAQAQLLEQGRAIATLEERQRLARELHDSLGQVLGYVGFQAEAVRTLFRNGKSAAGDEQLARLAGIAQDAHADVREFILNLRMGPSPNQPFFPALQRYLDSFSMQYGLHTALSIEDGLEEYDFEPDLRLQLFRIIQEALSNARRHAAAETIQVSFEAAGQSARIMVRDDGCGFEAGQPTGRNGFGLDFMRERAEQLGGELQLQSKPGAGTCVIVEIPLETGVVL
jgi:signal transduction histidine kinase